jgi:predicted metal-dependent enzyme (double-stranded beta helix superfamily)
MFDIDQFVADCACALQESQPHTAVGEVLERALSTPANVAEVLPTNRAELTPLHISNELTVLKVVWAPGMSFRPHNHLMWAAIGLYGGQEDNTFYRRSGDGIIESGGRQLRTGDVALLGDDTIHAVTNPRRRFTGAIHVYNGDIASQPGRSEWDEEDGGEIDYDFDRSRRYFASFQTPTPTPT